MIRYTLQCEQAHRFEAWFENSSAYDKQAAAGFVSCPECGSVTIEKTLMAPGVPKKTPEITPGEFYNHVRAFRSKVMAETEDVGHSFPEEARKMHDGEMEHRPIRGNASPEEVKELKEDGVPIAPIPPEPPTEN